MQDHDLLGLEDPAGEELSSGARGYPPASITALSQV
jgi:hypothetical protein